MVSLPITKKTYLHGVTINIDIPFTKKKKLILIYHVNRYTWCNS